jgi:hypothetical protein
MFDFESFVFCLRSEMLEVCDIASLGLMLGSARTCFQPRQRKESG